MKWLLIKFFDLLYHSFAWSYDLIAWIVSGGRWDEWVKSILPLITGMEVLELGSGTGHLQAAMIKRGFKATALDESRQMLRILNRKLEYKNSGERLRLIRGRAESMPLLGGYADTIAATFPSEYIGRTDAIKECRRVLKPGGRMVILLGVEIGGRGVYNLFLSWLYAVTLQKTPPHQVLEKALERLNDYGFQAHIEIIEHGHDRLTVIVAE